MSNFLNNLVARTLNLAPVVQPRITSRFEPVNPAAAVAPDQSVEVEKPTPPTATVRPEARVDDPKPLVAPPPQIEREQPRVDFQQVIKTIRNTQVESHEVVPVPVVEKIHERTHTETRILTEKNTDSRLEIRENQIPVAPPREVEKNPLNPRLNTPEPAPVVKEAPVTTPQPIVPRVVPRVEPKPTPAVQRFELPPVVQTEPTETINVTIGRVDVRAVVSSQAPAAPARTRTSSTNSLDDYLKQRSEGRR